MEFLADQYDLGVQYRSLTIYSDSQLHAHPQVDNVDVGSHPLVQRLLKGMFNSRPPVSHDNKSWNTSIVVEYIESCSTEELSALKLGKKQ